MYSFFFFFFPSLNFLLSFQQNTWVPLCAHVYEKTTTITTTTTTTSRYPLAFVGCRDGWLDLLQIPESKRTAGTLNKATIAILSVVTFLASKIKELAFIMSFAGATLGNCLIYVYPALMFRKAVKNMGDDAPKGLKREVPFAMFSATLGVVLGALGTKMALAML